MLVFYFVLNPPALFRFDDSWIGSFQLAAWRFVIGASLSDDATLCSAELVATTVPVPSEHWGQQATPRRAKRLVGRRSAALQSSAKPVRVVHVSTLRCQVFEAWERPLHKCSLPHFFHACRAGAPPF